jgi:hypothetical protein
MMAPMRRSSTTAVLAALILTMQVGPVLHLVTHRNDHTHGPAPARPAHLHTRGTTDHRHAPPQAAHEAEGLEHSHAHAAAHAAGRPHTHASVETGRAAAAGWRPHAAYGYSTPGPVRRLLAGLTEALAAAVVPASGWAHDNPSPTDADPSPVPSDDEWPSPGHGDGSAAHFGLALIEAPPLPPLLPSAAYAVIAPLTGTSPLRTRPALRRSSRGPPSPASAIRAC